MKQRCKPDARMSRNSARFRFRGLRWIHYAGTGKNTRVASVFVKTVFIAPAPGILILPGY